MRAESRPRAAACRVPVAGWLLGLAVAASGFAELPDFRPLLDWSDPAGTEQRQRELEPEARRAGDTGYLAELLTQIARTYSRRGDFEAAHRVLDEVEPLLSDDYPRAELRYCLERGRTFRLADNKDAARPLFHRAFDLGKRIGDEYLTVDAAHMIALAEPEFDGQLKWTLEALAVARRADDPEARGWFGSLATNLGWTYFDNGDYPEALDYFGRALAHWRESQAEPRRVLAARWNVARVYRALERFDEALALQEELLAEYRSHGLPVYGYVYEELAELYHRHGDRRAPAYFRLAYEALSDDVWMVNSQAERLARLRELGEVGE